MPKGIPLTPEELNRRRHQVFNASAGLFVARGFQETTIQEIAAAAGMGKSTLYDYFRTKDEILVALMEDEIYDITERARLIAARDAPAAEKLRQIIRAHLEYLLEKMDFFTRLLFEVQRLGLEAQQRLQVRRHDYQDLLTGLIAQAVAEGDFRPVTPLLAARAILALLTPDVYASHPGGEPQAMVDEIIDIFYRGVLA